MHARASLALVLSVCLSPIGVCAQSGGVSTTVSVPLADNDSATVTGVLSLQTRNGRQFLVLQSPTPYSLVHDHQAGEHTGKIIRDIAIHLNGRDADLTPLSGQTLTASGKLHFLPAASSWNGAILEATVVVLPGGKQLHSRR